MTAEPRGPLRRAGTVRFRVTALAVAAVAAVLLISSAGLVALQRTMLTHGIDEALRQRADNLAAAPAALPPGTVLPGEGDTEDSFLQVLDDSGRVVAATANMAGHAAAYPVPLPGPGDEALRTVHGPTPGGGDFRVLARRLTPAPGGATLVIGKNLDDVRESVRILTGSLAVSVPVAIALLALLVWWLTGRVLRSVESVRSEVASLGGDELHRRVRVPAPDDEISRLAETMNEMLDRVERSAARERAFVADSSHELRGPLTRLRAELEVTLQRARRERGPDDAVASLARHLLEDVVALQRLVDDLLYLARSDAGAPPAPGDPVDLDDLVLAEAGRLRERGRVTVSTAGVGAARVVGSAPQLARAVANLADNAERHARTRVTFTVREADGASEVVVEDDGPGIPEEHRENVFGRFTRLDAARSADTGGAGLGLAIVRDIVTRHGGTITAGATGDGGARLAMSLPRAD